MIRITLKDGESPGFIQFRMETDIGGVSSYETSPDRIGSIIASASQFSNLQVKNEIMSIELRKKIA